jgi:hypothetical protein
VAACGRVEEWRKHVRGSGDGAAGACEEQGGAHGGKLGEIRGWFFCVHKLWGFSVVVKGLEADGWVGDG